MAECKMSWAIKILFICFVLEKSHGYILNAQLLNEPDFNNITSFAEPLWGDIPASLDWRKYPGVTGVRDQGPCGACWAFSIIGCLESQILIKYQKPLDLSEQMLIDCADNGGCSSGSLVKGFAKLAGELGGVVSESDYPYRNKPQPGKCRDHNSMQKISVMGFNRVVPDEEQIRQHVARVGPLAAAINSNSMRDYPNKGGWIDTPTPQECSPDKLDHTVLIVGYDTYVNNGVEIPFWIIKNSWGTDWGDKGFYYLQRGQNACGIANDVAFGTIA